MTPSPSYLRPQKIVAVSRGSLAAEVWQDSTCLPLLPTPTMKRCEPRYESCDPACPRPLPRRAGGSLRT